ncbi:MAG TPA: OmpH family outer membrane protein [Chthonomonadaceae bacterium]|nr:OmpH family outer membrane protein [Chthonomonadaceae bacterium]
MSESTRSLRAIVLAAIVLCIVASLVGAKADQEKGVPAGLKVASVDVSKLLTDYKYSINTTNDLQKKNDNLTLRLRTIQQNFLLPEADQNTLADLAVQENSATGLTAAQKQQQTKLQGDSKSLMDQYTALQQKQVGALTQQDKDALQDFTRRASDTDTRLRTAEQQGKNDLEKQLQAAQTKAVGDVHEAVARVAKEKGFSLVLNSDVAFYADNDITDAVLSQLNK